MSRFIQVGHRYASGRLPDRRLSFRFGLLPLGLICAAALLPGVSAAMASDHVPVPCLQSTDPIIVAGVTVTREFNDHGLSHLKCGSTASWTDYAHSHAGRFLWNPASSAWSFSPGVRRVFIEIQDNADGVNEQYRIIAKDSGGNEIGSPIVYRKQDESGKVLTFSSNVSRLEAWHDGSRGDFAIFRLALPSHRLSLGLAGDGTVTSDVGGIDCGAASSDCEREFADLDPATVVTLTATPDTGQSFIGWTGCDSTAGTKCTVTMDKALHVHAEFTGFSFGYLAVEVQGSGSVKSSPGGINVGLGATSYETSFAIPNSVRLKASPKAGWRFLHWEGGRCSGSNPTCVLSVDDCFDVKAVFGKGDVKITSASTKPVQPKLTRRVPLKFKATGAGTAKVVLYRCSGSRCSRALLRRTIFANAGSNTLTVASRALPPGGYRLAVGNSAGASVTHFDVVAPRASFTG